MQKKLTADDHWTLTNLQTAVKVNEKPLSTSSSLNERSCLNELPTYLTGFLFVICCVCMFFARVINFFLQTWREEQRLMSVLRGQLTRLANRSATAAMAQWKEWTEEVKRHRQIMQLVAARIQNRELGQVSSRVFGPKVAKKSVICSPQKAVVPVDEFLAVSLSLFSFSKFFF